MHSKSRASRSLQPEAAEALALAVLAFLAAEPERLGAFLAETGLGPETVRAAAGDPSFLPAVLDYLIGQEPLLLAFAEEWDLDPAAVVAARAALSATEP